MNCQFCQNRLSISHYEGDGKTAVYQCLECPVLVWFHYIENDLTKVVYSIDKNGRNYIWTNNYLRDRSYITDVTPNHESHPLEKDPLLIRFPKLMNVTPANVRERFSFFMVFI